MSYPEQAGIAGGAIGEGAAQASLESVERARPAESDSHATAWRHTALGPSARRPIPPKLYRIGEVAAYAGTSRQTIHNYTTMGLLQESSWSEGGHRLYDETVFVRLDEILSMKAERRSLRDICDRFLGSGGAAGDAACAGGPPRGEQPD
jgi:hypothetical protein